MASNIDKTSLNILLIGKTGHGKSSTGNSILGRRAFKASAGSKSVTKEVTDAWTEDGQFEIKVIDGPGLEDTDLTAVQNKKRACENMAKALMMCNGGVHAFVLMFRLFIRFTEEEKRTISDLKQIFGESYLKNHGIIVFTGGDHFAEWMEECETPGKTFTEWCREKDAEFGNLFKECSFRVVMFNNRSQCEEEKIKQRNELLDHVKQLRQTKGLYTSEHFQKYAEVRKKLVTDSQQKILDETVQKRIAQLLAELEPISKNSSETDIDRVDVRVRAVYTEIVEEGKQQESMKPLIANLDRLSRTLLEIRAAIEEKNETKKQRQLEAISRRNQELKDSRMSTWGNILAITGVGSGIVGAYSGNAGFVSLGSSLLNFAYKFLKK